MSRDETDHRSLAGTPLPARRHLGRRGRQLRAVLRARRGRRAVPVRRHRPARAAARSRCPSAPTRSGTAICPRRGPGSSTAIACTARTSPSEGHRFNPNKLLLDPYARNIVGALRWSDALFGYTRRPQARGPVVRPPRQRRAACRSAGSSIPRSPGATTGRRDVPWHDTVIYELHVRGFTMRHPDVPPALRGTYAGLATAPVIEHLQAPRRHHGRADAGARVRRRPPPGRAGPAQLLGLQHDRLLRARRALFRVGQGERVQDDGEDAARGRASR